MNGELFDIVLEALVVIEGCASATCVDRTRASGTSPERLREPRATTPGTPTPTLIATGPTTRVPHINVRLLHSSGAAYPRSPRPRPDPQHCRVQRQIRLLVPSLGNERTARS